MNWLKRIRENEPVRMIVYPIAVLAGGYAVVRGVDVDLVDLVLGMLAVVIGVEAARAKVSPVKGRL